MLAAWVLGTTLTGCAEILELAENTQKGARFMEFERSAPSVFDSVLKSFQTSGFIIKVVDRSTGVIVADSELKTILPEHDGELQSELANARRLLATTPEGNEAAKTLQSEVFSARKIYTQIKATIEETRTGQARVGLRFASIDTRSGERLIEDDEAYRLTFARIAQTLDRSPRYRY